MKRRTKVLAGLALAGVVVGCGESSNPVRPSLSSDTWSATVGARADSAPAAQGDSELSPDLAAVRRATAAFHDPDNAFAAGYQLAPRCVETSAGAMGIHAANPALVASQALDPEQPEQLLYLPQPDGGLRLIGVEYFQVVLLRNTTTEQVGPWFSSAPWPSSYEVVTPTPELFGQVFVGPMPGHNPSQPWHWDFHAWIWAHNPSGMFAEYNPTLRCGV